VENHHGAAELVEAPFDRTVDDRASPLLDGQIAGDHATQMQGGVATYKCVPLDASLDVEITIDRERPFDFSLHGLHEASFAAGNSSSDRRTVLHKTVTPKQSGMARFPFPAAAKPFYKGVSVYGVNEG
jgi:hypothetical protein